MGSFGQVKVIQEVGSPRWVPLFLDQWSQATLYGERVGISSLTPLPHASTAAPDNCLVEQNKWQ